MAQQLHIISTLTRDHEFPIYEKSAPGRAPVIKKSIIIYGKAGLPNKHLLVRDGVATPVESGHVDMLREQKVFQRLEAAGHLTVTGADPRDADRIAKDMAKGDGSEQLTEAKLKERKPDAAKVKASGA